MGGHVVILGAALTLGICKSVLCTLHCNPVPRKSCLRQGWISPKAGKTMNGQMAPCSS